jgi:hypothetical protein
MKKVITATFVRASRVAISGMGPGVKGYDDNSIRVNVRIKSGPQAMLDRHVHVDIPLNQFASMLPSEVRNNLRQILDDLSGP